MGSSLTQKALFALVVLVGAVLCLVPTIVRDDALSAKWFTRPLGLGLDISGGVHLAYGVKASEAVKSQLTSMLAGLRSELRSKKIAVSEARLGPDNTVEVTLLSGAFLAEAKKILADKLSELTFVREDIGGSRPKIVYGIQPEKVKKIEKDAIDQAVEVLRNRVDQFGVAEPLIQRAGDDRIILQMPGVSDVKAVKNVVGSVAKLEFHLIPNGQSSSSTITLKDKAGVPIVVEDQALMTGDAVSDARVSFDDQGQVEVSLKLSKVGSDTFARITSENVNRELAIVLDGVVYSHPVIRQAITGGNASISGGFTMPEAQQLKVVLKAGALPAPLEVLEERTVGPTLGMDSIKKAMLGSGVGFGAILLFMVFYYKKSGLVAVVTLILNTFFVLAALSLFGATLTLPGIAGLALTIGMAVDSNVIIFERIRDEIRAGKARDIAVANGFDKAFSAIFDSNVATLLSGIILYNLGTGPVRGFAVTLCIGIATTLFCAVFLARLIFDYLPLSDKKNGLSI